MNASDLAALPADIADAAVLGILKTVRWKVGIVDAVETPLSYDDPHYTYDPEPGWTYLTAYCEARRMGVVIRARLVTDADEFGGTVLCADWELLELSSDQYGTKTPYDGTRCGRVESKYPSSSVTIL